MPDTPGSDPCPTRNKSAATVTTKPNDGLKFLGLAGVACLACCAGPLLGVIGGIGLAGLLSTTVIGGLGLVVAIAAALAFFTVRSRSSRSCDTPSTEVPVHIAVHRAVSATKETTTL